MVNSYLEKLYQQYTDEKLEIENKINTLQIHLKENMEFIKLLNESNDPNYESFTPREVNGKNKAKILELKNEQKEIQQELEQIEKDNIKCKEKLDELEEVMKEARENQMRKSAEAASGISGENLLEIQENERQRISRELHDATVQNLTGLVHKVELCSKLVEMDPIRCKLELNMITKNLRDVINDTRQMIYNLRPMSFDDIGLDVTIERAIEKIEGNEIKKINFTVNGESYKIKPVVGITILRIIQEACSNAMRHGQASLIRVILDYQPNKISIKVEDNGVGFDTDSYNNELRGDNSGFGLSMMKERVFLLSGTIDIDSKINTGTKIYVEIPVNKEEE